jgi:hypothetical protein
MYLVVIGDINVVCLVVVSDIHVMHLVVIGIYKRDVFSCCRVYHGQRLDTPRLYIPITTRYFTFISPTPTRHTTLIYTDALCVVVVGDIHVMYLVVFGNISVVCR